MSSDLERDLDLGNPKPKKRKLKTGELIQKKKEIKKFKHERLLKSLEKSQTLCKERSELVEGLSKSIPDSLGRPYTVSLALPGSILDNAQTPELRTYLAGQIARSLAIFSVDEVVIFDDEGNEEKKQDTEGEFQGIGKKGQGCVQIARILQFLECPQYLRKHFFPIHKDLKYAGLLNPTDMPHHLRSSELSPYREGVVVDRPSSKHGSLVEIGLRKEIVIDKTLQPGLRVTVKFDPEQTGNKFYGKVVSPHCPRTESGLYWGYNVRLADSLSQVLTKSPFKGGYDLTVGTSERGQSVDTVTFKEDFKHLLIVFGGVKGLEAALEVDDDLEGNDPAPLFDLYLNTCPNQGSRTIRTEEAILVSMAAIRPKILTAQHKF